MPERNPLFDPEDLRRSKKEWRREQTRDWLTLAGWALFVILVVVGSLKACT